MIYELVVDKQNRDNPSSEKKIYKIDIEELRKKGEISDCLCIEKDRTYVLRRLELSEFQVLNVLEKPKIEELEEINVELFEGDNYIYLFGESENEIFAEYLIKNDFTDTYVTEKKMKTAIKQSSEIVEISVNKTLEKYSTTDEMNATIKVKAEEITNEVKGKIGKEEIGTYIKQNAEAILYAWNQISQYIQFEAISDNASMVVYDKDSQKLMVLDRYGQEFYFSGKTVGNIGTASHDDKEQERGLVFNLEKDAVFMAWGQKEDDENSYSIKLGYWKDYGLKLGSDLHTNGQDIYIGGDDKIAIRDNNIYNKINGNVILGFTVNQILNCYDHLDMNGWEVRNANNLIVTDVISKINMPSYNTDRSAISLDFVTKNDGTFRVQINTSDGRLKKDISDSEVDALEVINKIKHRQFKWKNGGTFQEIGYIAQELEKINKNFITKVEQTDAEGKIIDYLYQVSDKDIIPYLTRAIQQLYKTQKKYISIIEEQQTIIDKISSKLKMEKESIIKDTIENLISHNMNTSKPDIYNDEIKFTKLKEIIPKEKICKSNAVPIIIKKEARNGNN